MKVTCKREIRFINGKPSIPAGSEVILTPKEFHVQAIWVEKNYEAVWTERECALCYHNLHRYFDEFCEPPSIEELKEWSEDGGCSTPLGSWTELDGYDEEGFPSWMIILGYI